MNIFDRVNGFVGDTETLIKGAALVFGALAALKCLDWLKNVTITRLILAALIAGLVIVIVRNPDLLSDDIEKTVALNPPASTISSSNPAALQPTGNDADRHLAVEDVTGRGGAA